MHDSKGFLLRNKGKAPSIKKGLKLVVTDFIVSTQRDIPDPGNIDSPGQTGMIRINSPPPGELYHGGELDARKLSPIS